MVQDNRLTDGVIMREVVISSNAKLSYQMGYLVIRRDDVKKIHIKDIDLLIIESTTVSLTAALLSELVKHKVKVIFCDEKRLPSSELMPYYGAHDSSRKIRKQIRWIDDIKKEIWTEIVKEKIRQQAKLLAEVGRPEAKMLYGYIDEITFADASNREGHAAKVYFNALFGMEFYREKDCAINAALNYGYTILLSSFSRAVVANGYITQLGVNHTSVFNQFNLASDLMEPFRPLMDRVVLNMQPEYFDFEEKMQLVNVLNQTVYVKTREELVSNAIAIYCKSVFDAIDDNDTSLIRFYDYEL